MDKLTFLIVDDYAMNRLLLSDMVNSINHTSIHAENGEVALQWLEKKKIDIILMDIEMPKMNGFETTIYIRTKTNPPIKNIPIIAITAHNLEGYHLKFVESGFNGYIIKPFLFEDFKKTMEKYIHAAKCI